jgi:UMF1 family MFS transporter
MRYQSLLHRLGLHRRELRAWAYYDIANSAWMTTMIQAFSPAFLVPYAASQLPENVARSRFAFVTSAMVIAAGLIGPWLGALADYKAKKKVFMAGFLVAGALLTAALLFVREGQWPLALALYGLGNVAVTSTLAFYNALLPGIAAPDEVDRVSTAGFALGYLGGGLLFALNGWMMASPATFGLASAPQAFQVSCVMVAGWWLLFSIPLLRHVKEPRPRLQPGETEGESAGRIALRRLRDTFRELRQHRDAGLLLLAFVLYNDGVNTIIRVGTTFADEIGLPTGQVFDAVLMIQFVGIPFAFAFGMLADRIGAKRAIYLALAVYVVITVAAYGMSTIRQFFAFAFVVAMVMGGEMFGFFGIFDRFGGAIGLTVFGAVLALTGSSRPAIASLVLLFIAGALVLSRVDVQRGRRLAREAELAVAPAPGAPPGSPA